MPAQSPPSDQRRIERLASLSRAWNELNAATSSVELCRAAVQQGITSLGIARLSIWLIDDDPLKPKGSFGTDESGDIRDERDVQLNVPASSSLGRTLTGAIDLSLTHNCPLRNHLAAIVGYGTQVVVPIHDGHRVIGALVGDDLLNQHPLRLYDVEVLRLYGTSLGHLLSRQRAIDAKETVDAQYRAVVDNADDRIIMIDRQGQILFTNHALPHPAAEAAGMSIYDHAFDDQRGRLHEAVERVFETGSPTQFEIMGYNAEGQRQWFFARIGPIAQNGDIRGAVITSTNIHNLKTAEEALRRHQEDLEHAVNLRTAELGKTNQALRAEVKERVRVERALRSSETRFRLLAENVPGVIYLCRNDERYTMLFLNDEVEAVTGYQKEMFLEDQISFVDLYHPDDLPTIGPVVDEALAAKKQFSLQYRIRHRNGQWRWVEEHGVGVFDGDELRMLEGYLHDVTDRRESEMALRDAHDQLEQRVAERTEALTQANAQLQREVRERRAAQEEILHKQKQLRSLTSQLMIAEERERRRIAADIHDHIGQTLSLTQIKLHSLTRETLSERGRKALKDGMQLLTNTISDTRTLIFDLSPPVLYDFGLSAAIEWVVDRFNESSEVVISLKCHEDVEDKIDEALAILMYRSVRELLVNALKYAQAENIRITVERSVQTVKITVSDDGVGLDPKAIASAPDEAGRFGLFNMRQQLQQIGGELKIGNSEKRGTSVTIMAPVNCSISNPDGGLTS